MNIDGKGYTLKDTENLEGTTESEVTAKVKTYPGFTSPKEEKVKISADGSTLVEYKYTRNKYTLTLKGDKGIDTLTGSGEYYYETKVKVTATIKDGYTFNKWDNNESKLSFDYKVPANDSVINASTNLIEYKITYNLDGGSATNPEKYTVEDEITLNNPTKTGYTFTGWNDLGEIVKINKGTTGDLTFNANYTVNTYTVSFDLEGLDDPEPITVTYGKPYENIREDFTREHYRFAGWFTSKTGYTRVNKDSIVNIASDHTLYGRWYSDIYDIIFETFGGSYVSSQRVAYNNKVLRPSVVPTKADFTFINWFTDDTLQTEFDFDNTLITNDTTIYAGFEMNINEFIDNAIDSISTDAKFERDNDKISAYFLSENDGVIKYYNSILSFFDNFDKTNFNSIVLQYNGKSIDYLKSSTVEMARFIGWVCKGTWSGEAGASCKTKDLLNKDIEIDLGLNKGLLSQNRNRIEPYLIEFKVANPEDIITVDFVYNENESESVNIIKGNRVKEKTVSSNQYESFKWQLNGEDFDFNTRLYQNTVLNAVYELKKFLVTFDTRGGTPEDIPNQIIEYGGKVIKPDVTPEKLGYKFKNWYYISGTNEYKFSFSTKITRDTQIVAHYDPMGYNLKYDPNGGKMPDSTSYKYVKYDSPYGEFKIPTRDGYTFDGWYTEKTDGIKLNPTDIVKITSNITIYAHWIKN